jgi:hypothetical protein
LLGWVDLSGFLASPISRRQLEVSDDDRPDVILSLVRHGPPDPDVNIERAGRRKILFTRIANPGRDSVSGAHGEL